MISQPPFVNHSRPCAIFCISGSTLLHFPILSFMIHCEPCRDRTYLIQFKRLVYSHYTKDPYATEQGFEPRLPSSELGGLPLADSVLSAKSWNRTNMTWSSIRRLDQLDYLSLCCSVEIRTQSKGL